jgi:hypothetical protein
MPAPLISLVGVSLRFLVGLSDSFLIDLGAYEASLYSPLSPALAIFWALVSLSTGLCFFFFPVFRGFFLCSWERLYRNAWWLERELSEALGIFFKKKHDRRSLFLIPLVYQAPLRKVFPVGGFFEITLSHLNRTLV